MYVHISSKVCLKLANVNFNTYFHNIQSAHFPHSVTTFYQLPSPSQIHVDLFLKMSRELFISDRRRVALVYTRGKKTDIFRCASSKIWANPSHVAPSGAIISQQCQHLEEAKRRPRVGKRGKHTYVPSMQNCPFIL